MSDINAVVQVINLLKSEFINELDYINTQLISI